MLFVITNRKIIKKDGFLQVIEDASAGGADCIILREKDLETKELLEIAYKIREKIKDKDTRIIINGNLYVAEKIKAHGVHYSFDEFKKNRPAFSGLIGVSVHSVEEAVEAERLSADYVLAGHIFKTECKKGLKPRGTDFIKDIKGKVNIPVIALGGINFQNADSVLKAGADGLAVMSLIMSSENPFEDTSKLRNIILQNIEK